MAIAVTLVAVWWTVPSVGAMHQLCAESDQLQPSIDFLDQSGARIQLSTCGLAKRLCVLVDHVAGEYGDVQREKVYIIAKGYWTTSVGVLLPHAWRSPACIDPSVAYGASVDAEAREFLLSTADGVGSGARLTCAARAAWTLALARCAASAASWFALPVLTDVLLQLATIIATATMQSACSTLCRRF